MNQSPSATPLTDALAQIVDDFNTMSASMRLPRTVKYRSTALFAVAMAFAIHYPELAAEIFAEGDMEAQATSAAKSFAEKLSRLELAGR